jgi:hypothetical protein
MYPVTFGIRAMLQICSVLFEVVWRTVGLSCFVFTHAASLVSLPSLDFQSIRHFFLKAFVLQTFGDAVPHALVHGR